MIPGQPRGVTTAQFDVIVDTTSGRTGGAILSSYQDNEASIDNTLYVLPEPILPASQLSPEGKSELISIEGYATEAGRVEILVNIHSFEDFIL